jgi:hypothetical protein
MSADRQGMLASSGDHARSDGGRGSAEYGERTAGRNTAAERRERGEVPVERWRMSPHCTERERRERWPLG